MAARLQKSLLSSISFLFITALSVMGPKLLAYEKDKSGSYLLGTYVTADAVADGTITDNFNCGPETFGSTVCSGGVHTNGVIVYQLKVPNGVWRLETMRQATDTNYRQLFGEEPLHLKAEKNNPLDLLKNGDRVLFRVEEHRKLNGIDHDIFIPFADAPNKEAKFIGTFFPANAPARPAPASDNVRAMCDSHKLSPELEKQFCTSSTGPVVTADNNPPQAPQDATVSSHVGLDSRCGVYTIPTGAEIFIDGKKIGIAPMAFVLLNRGDTPRVVTIKLDGYKTVEKKLVPDGKLIALGLTLEKENP